MADNKIPVNLREALEELKKQKEQAKRESKRRPSLGFYRSRFKK